VACLREERSGAVDYEYSWFGQFGKVNGLCGQVV